MATNPSHEIPKLNPVLHATSCEFKHVVSGTHRLSGLNLLRFVAVVLVMFRHLSLDPATPLGNTFAVLRCGGWVGVSLFFALSGYLIFSLLLGEIEGTGKLDLRRFYVRRSLKIIPPLYLLVLPMVALEWDNIQGWELFKGVVGELFFLQNYLGRLFPHTWSLAVEEHSYILLSLVVFVYGRQLLLFAERKPLVGVAVAAATLLMFLASRLLTDQQNVVPLLYKTHLIADGFVPGVLLAMLLRNSDWKRRLTNWPTLYVLAIGTTLLLPAFVVERSSSFMLTWGYSLVSVGSGFLLLAALKVSDVLPSAFHGIARIGAASYSIYLIHIPVAHLCFDWLSLPTLGASLLYGLGSVGFGLAIFHWIERPILSWRDRVFPGRVRTRDAIFGLSATSPPNDNGN